MSKAYNLFIKEYNSTGREKLDGYSPINADQLSTTEKEDIILKLEKELPSFYGAIPELIKLNKKSALTKLSAIVNESSKESLSQKYEFFYWLWHITKEEKYALNFIDCRKYIKNELNIGSFYSYATRFINSSAIKKMFFNAIFEEDNETGISVSANYILSEHGVTREKNKEKYTKLWTTLYEGSRKEKEKILKSLRSED